MHGVPDNEEERRGQPSPGGVTRVLFDSRLAIRGLGIGTSAQRLVAAMESMPEVDLTQWQAAGPWDRSAALRTLARSGLFDVSPMLDPRSRRFEIVHYWSNFASIVPTRASVMTVHDLVNRGRTIDHVTTALRRHGVRRVTRIVATTSQSYEQLVELCGAGDRVRLIPFGMRTDVVPAPTRTHVLAFAGVDPRKRFPLAIAAYRAYVRRTRDPLPLVVLGRGGVGSGDRAALAALGARVVPDATDADVRDLLSGAAVLVYPTRWEGFGLPLVEAAESYTRAVIAADARFPCEVVGAHVVRVESNDEECWGEAIAAAAEAPPLTVCPLHLASWGDVARAYVSLYQELLGT